MAFTKLEPKSVNTSATFTFADANITGNLDVNGKTNLGSAANITISGGSAGQVLSTDGTGQLSWADGGTGGDQVVVSGFTGITQDTFTGDGTEINFTLSATPDSRDFVYVNIDGITQQRTAYDISNDEIIFTEPPLDGEVIEVTTYLARGLTTAGSNTQVQYNNNGELAASANFTFNSSTGVLQASFLKGDGYQIGNIRAANIYGEVPSSHMAGTVFMNAQPNITSVGTLIDLTVDGNVTATKFIGDGSGLTGISAGVSTPAGANTQVQFNDNGTTGGNSSLTFIKTTGTLSATKFAGDGSLLTGVVTDLTGYATQTYVNTQISNLVDSAPTTLNTLNELASALGDDSNFSTTVTNTLANKLNSNAFTYANITGKPTIPSDISDLTDSTNLLGASALTELTGVVINSGTLVTGQVLKYDGTNWVNGTDATSGTSGGGVPSYIDLTDKPFIPYDVSELTDTTNLLISSYNDLSDKPTIPTDISDLTDTTNLLSSGVTSYNDLTDKPTIPTDVSDLTDTTNLLISSYNDLTGKPILGTAAATDATDYATATQGAKADTALQPSALTGYATESYVGTQISNLVDAAPTTLNTLNELASALGDDPSFATSMTSLIGEKLATADFASTATTWLGTKSTSNLAEGANLYYTVARANTAIDSRVTKTYIDNLNIIASTVTSSSQPSVTSLGTLTSLTVNGITTLGANSNVMISGGSTGQVLSTDGTGNLSWVAQSSGGTPGGTDTQVQFNDGGSFGGNSQYTYDKTTNTLSVGNITANGSGLSSITGANVTGQVGNALVAGTVYTNAQPNITSVGTLTELNVAGNTSFTVGFVTFRATQDSTLSSSPSGLKEFDLTTGAVFDVTPSASWSINVVNVPTTNNRTTITTFIVTQGATGYLPTDFQIAGTSQTVKWIGSTAPTASSNKIDVVSYSIIRSSSGTWVVLGQAASYG